MDSALTYLQSILGDEERNPSEACNDEPCAFSQCHGELSLDEGIVQMEEQTRKDRKRKHRTYISGLIKTKSLEMASKLSILQSFSNEHPSIDIQKSGSSLSKSTASFSTERNNDSDFSSTQSSDSYEIPRGNADPKRKKKGFHIQWFSHGILWTTLAIFSGWMGFACSYEARHNKEFISLITPMYVDPRYQMVPGVGLIQIELCYNQTHLELIDEPVRQNYPELQVSSILNDDACTLHRISSDDVQSDTLFVLSQSAAFLALAFGLFSSIFLSFAVYWKTINLRPIGGGYLLAYFLQSFTFMIFDSNVCNEHSGCSMSSGSIFSVVASICWIIACAASSRMESRKIKNEGLELQEDTDIPIDGDDQTPPTRRQTKSKTRKPKTLSSKHRSKTAETVAISDDEETYRAIARKKKSRKKRPNHRTENGSKQNHTTVVDMDLLSVPPPQNQRKRTDKKTRNHTKASSTPKRTTSASTKSRSSSRPRPSNHDVSPDRDFDPNIHYEL